ncbi:hypothetical protein YQE_05358, partial [Dendroctonus ponderosae]
MDSNGFAVDCNHQSWECLMGNLNFLSRAIVNDLINFFSTLLVPLGGFFDTSTVNAVFVVLQDHFQHAVGMQAKISWKLSPFFS